VKTREKIRGDGRLDSRRKVTMQKTKEQAQKRISEEWRVIAEERT
jgi:hypothetical protein